MKNSLVIRTVLIGFFHLNRIAWEFCFLNSAFRESPCAYSERVLSLASSCLAA